jgi:hypothetical protein
VREGPRLGHSIGGHHAKGLLFVLMGKHRSFHESKTYERVVSLLNKTSLTVMPPQPEVFVWIAQAVYGRAKTIAPIRLAYMASALLLRTTLERPGTVRLSLAN